MTLQKIYSLSKTIHRITMWLCIALGVPVATTGMILENEILSSWAASNDWGYKVRYLHSSLSSKFAILLFVMIVTGFLMWLIPQLLKKKAQASIKE